MPAFPLYKNAFPVAIRGKLTLCAWPEAPNSGSAEACPSLLGANSGRTKNKLAKHNAAHQSV